jgi:hypothetical protein
MQVIYAIPFFLLSVFCFLACLAIPKIRRYALQAAVAPLAFGFCSIVGAGAVVLIADYAGLQIAVLSRPLVGLGGFLTVLTIYFVPGVLGTWLAISITGRLRARFSK